MTSLRLNRFVDGTMEKMFLDRNETGDIKFNIDGEIIPAHRCVLAALSLEHEEKFYGLEPHKVFNLTNVSAAAFKEFLQFYYLQKVVLTTENVETVLNLAKQSLVENFVTECVSFLVEKLSMENICMAYRLAITYDIENLKELCESIISSNANDLFRTDGFINCDIRVLISILKLDLLDCPEAEIFKSCIAWAQNSCRKKNIDVDDMTNLRAELGDAFYEIRFGTMNHAEYAEIHKSYNGLFSTDEFTEILYMVGKIDNFKSMKFNQAPRENKHKMSIAAVQLSRRLSKEMKNQRALMPAETLQEFFTSN